MPDASRHDVLVVGGGPAGIAAAWAAAMRGKTVALLDDNATPGGQGWRAAVEPPPAAARRWLDRLRKTSCEIFTRTSVVARLSEKILLAETPDGPRLHEFDKLVLATGARELFIPFPGWTLPGVFGVGGLQALVKSGLPVKGKHIVVAGSGPLLMEVARLLRIRGAEIMCVAEQAPPLRVHRFAASLAAAHPIKFARALATRARLLHVPYDVGWWVSRVEGNEKLQSVTLTNDDDERNYICDWLACGYGFAPNVELPVLLGCELAGGFARVNPSQETNVAGIYCAGEPTGIAGAPAAIVQGMIAGAAAAGDEAVARRFGWRKRRWDRYANRLASAYALRSDLRGDVGDDTPVCRCEDITLRLLKRHDSWRDAQLQSRLGTGPCSGRVCGPACKFIFGWQNDTIRPPLQPTKARTLIAGVRPPA